MKKYYSFVLAAVALFFVNAVFSQEQSVARMWDEVVIQAIRNDNARPTIHARNLFHIHAAMYDAWAVYDDTASTYLLGQTLHGFTSAFNGVATPADVQVAREKAISYAVYRMILNRYQYSPLWTSTQTMANTLMNTLGYSTAITSTDYSDNDPAKLGNYIAAQWIAYGNQDGSNQLLNFANQYYVPVNNYLLPNFPGNPNMSDINRWQPLNLSISIDQNGFPVSPTQTALSPEWGNVSPFSLTEADKSVHVRNGNTYNVYKDPGPQPVLAPTDTATIDHPMVFGNLVTLLWSSHLTSDDTTMLDISPGSICNVQSYPNSLADYPNFYNLFNGGDTGTGRAINPYTGQPYTPQFVKRGDFTRVLAEFWADGPNSETPPGHWFTILNYVSDHPLFQKRWMGQGAVLDNLEWDVRSYFALGGAVHDAAICAWGIKGYYDGNRPVSVIRKMADNGQSSDPNQPNYNIHGLPLIPGYIELVTAQDVGNGFNTEDIGQVKVKTWKGPSYVTNTANTYAGVGWILAKNWFPYQRPSFVTPPFPGYISGHSTYSRTAAELMIQMTGSEYFPGGMGEFHATANQYLVFEDGPSTDVTLQWCGYRDASDQCSLSRIWGGIHATYDDIPGRKIGMVLGPQAFNFANGLNENGVARITSVTFSDNILSSGDYLANADVFFHFNEPMNTSVIPTVAFYGLDLTTLNVLIPVGGAWVDNQTYKYTYTLNSVTASYSGITFRVTDGVAQDGGNARAYIGGSWKIDIQIPVATSTVAATSWVSDQTVAAGSFEVLVYFDKSMNTNANPAISFPNNISGSLIYNSSASYWSNAATFHAVINPTDAQEEVNAIDINVQYARDLAGNSIVPTLTTGAFNIDTRNPSFIASSNASLINDAAAGMAVSLEFQFDEAMQLSSGSYYFNEGTGVNASFATNSSGWQNNDTYAVALTAVDNNVYFATSTPQFVGYDLHGNSCQINSNSPWLIDTENPAVVQIIPSSNWFTGATGWYIDIVFTEPMNTASVPTLTFDDSNLSTGYLTQTSAQWVNTTTYRVFYEDQIMDGAYFNAAVSVTVDAASDVNANPMTNTQVTNAFGVDIPGLVDESGLSAIRVYPNPAKDVLILDGFATLTQVVVMDEIGQAIYTNMHASKAMVDISNWASGVYFVKSIQGNQSLVTKLIVE